MTVRSRPGMKILIGVDREGGVPGRYGYPISPGGEVRRDEGVSRQPVLDKLVAEAAPSAEFSVSIPLGDDAVSAWTSGLMRVHATMLWTTLPKQDQPHSGSDQ